MSFLNPKRWYHSLGKRRFYEALLLIVFILFFYGPLLYTFMLAFANKYEYPSIIPSQFGFQWWTYVLNQPTLVKSIGLSFEFAFATTFISMIICLPAAYVLARYNFPGRKMVMFSFLLGNAFPKIGIYTSMAIVFYKMNLMGTFTGVLLIHLIECMMMMIWLPTSAFRNVPANQEEAARDAGAGPLRTFWYVTLPTAWPGIAVAAMFAFIASLGESTGTLLVGLPYYRTMTVEMYGVILDYPSTAGAVFSLILIAPNLALLLLMRRYLGADTLARGYKMG